MKDLSKSYREINIILNLLGTDFSNKIPNEMKNFFVRNEEKTYNPNITLEDVFSNKILSDTTSIIAILYINYWTENQAEKEKYMSIIREFDEEKKKQLFEMFDNPKQDMIENTQEKQLIVKSEKLSLKEKMIEILEKIKSLFKKKS